MNITEITNYSYKILDIMGVLTDHAGTWLGISAIIGIVWMFKNRNKSKDREKQLIEWSRSIKKRI